MPHASTTKAHPAARLFTFGPYAGALPGSGHHAFPIKRLETVFLRPRNGSGAKLVGIESGVISGLNFNKPIRRLAAAEGDNANDDRYSKLASW